MSAVKEFIAPFQVPESFKSLRQQGLKELDQLDFPGRKSEKWKYTRTARLSKMAFRQKPYTEKIDLSTYKIPGFEGYVLVFVNGILQAQASDVIKEDGIQAGDLLSFETDYQSNSGIEGIFSSINKVFFTNGFYLSVDRNKTLSKPVHILNLSGGEFSTNQLRHRILLKEGAKANVIFTNHSLDGHAQFNNTVLEADLQANSALHLIKVQNENDQTHSITLERINQDRDSRFSINTLTTGGKLVRNDLEIDVNGSNCDTRLNGAYILSGEEHVDNHTVVDHKVADCFSSELYKGVMDGKSTGVFNGKVFVREDAQRINAFQSNANILLSDTAAIYTKPELEIYADDVKCSHGSTTGQLDQDAVFYLRARGMSLKSAERLLVTAFVKEVFENIEDERIGDWLNTLVDQKFSRNA